MSDLCPVRILHVVGAMNIAGTETMLMNIYRNIDRDKVQFDFISYEQVAHYDAEIQRMGGRVIKLANTLSVKEIYDAIKTYGPYYAVHSHTLFHCGIANLAASLAGVKVRISHSHTTLDKSDSFIRKLYIHSMRYAIRAFSTDLLACSNEAGKYLFGEYNLNKSNYKYFPNLIDSTKFMFKKIGEVEKFKVEQRLENKIVIGHIGRFIEAKNHAFLLDVLESALKRSNNIKLLLVGDGDLKQQVEESAKQRGIYEYVCFAGLRNDIPTILHSMDIFVFPSTHEGLGLVLLEAQASGIPCIVSEAIQPEADLHIDLVSRLNLADGPDAWADKILELACNKETDLNKIARGFEQNEYSLSVGISKLMKIYRINLEAI